MSGDPPSPVGKMQQPCLEISTLARQPLTMRRIPALALMLLLFAGLGAPACFFGPNAFSGMIKTRTLAIAHHAGDNEPAHNIPSSPHHPASMPDFCALACVTLAAAPAFFGEPDWPEGQRLLPPVVQPASPRIADRIERPPRHFS